MASLKDFSMGYLIIFLFTFTILLASIEFISNTNPDSEVLSSTYGLNQSKTSLDSGFNRIQNLSENIKIQIEDDRPTAVDYLFLIFKGAYYIPVTFIGVIYDGFNLILAVIFPFLGGTGVGSFISALLTVLFSALTIILVLAIVRGIRTGDTG